MIAPIIHDVIIIGGGPAGVSAGIWCKRLGLSPIILEKNDQLGGQLHHIYNQIIDYPGLLCENGKELIQQLNQHLQFLSVPIITHQNVTRIEIELDLYRIISDSNTFLTKFVILATGSEVRKLSIPGEEEMVARGEIYSSNRDLKQLAGKRIMIVGGGDRAFEGVINLAEIASDIILVHRREIFRARKELIDRALKFPNVKIIHSAIIEALHGEQQIEAVTVYHKSTQNHTIIPIDAILIRIGNQAVDHLAPAEVKRNSDGAIFVNEDGRTNLSTFYAIGDVINLPEYSSLSVVVGQGMRAAKSIVTDIAESKKGESNFR